MNHYADNNGNSSVDKYKIGSDYIVVKFKDNKYSSVLYYRYTHASGGQPPIEEMKRLAQFGSGLSSYINTRKVQHLIKGETLESV
jgi:hypothetical protein